MSGTINLALSQQFDMDGEPLSGGLLYFFQAGTSTPQNAFQDTALTIVHPNPLVLDASGRIPMFYVASTEPPNIGQTPNGQIKIRLTDKGGVTVIAADNLLVIGPAGGGGGGGGVDPTTVITTGDIKARYGTGTLTGFVRCNGNTIGNGTSGATERANADCQALFEYLWSTGVLGVFSGSTPNRGATATGDFTASKNILLPDLRGRTLAGLDDMGATAASRLTAAFFGASATVLGNAGGDEKHKLTNANQLPTFTPAGTVTGVSASGTSSGSFSGSISGSAAAQSVTIFHAGGNITPGGSAFLSPAGSSPNVYSNDGTSAVSGSCSGSYSGSASVSDGTGTFTGTLINPSGAADHATATPAMVLTFYIKL